MEYCVNTSLSLLKASSPLLQKSAHLQVHGNVQKRAIWIVVEIIDGSKLLII